MSREPQNMAIFLSTLHDKNWQSSVNVTIWPTFRSGDVIDDVMSV